MEEKEIKEVPKGFYLAEVPASFTNAIVLEDNVIDASELLVLCANALVDAGLLNLKDKK